MASASSMVSVSVEGWTEVATASGANRVVTVELIGGKQVHFAADDASANIPAGYTGQKLVTKGSPVGTILVQEGEKLFAKTDYPNCTLAVWEYDDI